VPARLPPALARTLPGTRKAAMTREQMVVFFDRRQDALVRRDVAALLADYAEDCVLESPWAGMVKGRAAIDQVNRGWFEAFPDVTFDRLELLIDGHRAAQFSAVSGTDRGGFMGLPPTGKPFRISLVLLCTLNEQLIVHEQRIYDFTGMLMQIGLLKARPA
jgi:predicted ester cyclase